MIPYRFGIVHRNDIRAFFFRAPVVFGDVLMVAVAYSLAYAVRFQSDIFIHFFPVTKGYPTFPEYVSAAPVVLIMWVLALSWVGCYKRIQLQALDEVVRIFRATFVGTLLAMSAMFLYRQTSFSRLVFVLGGLFSYFYLYVFRQFVKVVYIAWIQRKNRAKRVLIIGTGYLIESLKKILESHGDRAVLIAEKFEFESVKKTISRSRINEVLLAHSDMNHNDTIQLTSYCEDKGVICRLIPDILEIRMGELLIDESLGVPTFQIKPVSLQGSAFLTKRIMDVVLATLLVGIFFLPLFTIAVLIKFSSRGPVFYRHLRVGFKGRPFQFMKFRTMVTNADELLGELKKKSDRGGPVFKMKNDPRVTQIGKFLRRYSLDEIPQLINVLRGEMSIVGPRPQVLWEAKHYDEWAKKRLNVLPGITGLWQVSGRAELTYEEMIDLDIYYIERWSPGLDIKILLKTFPAVLLAKGAY